MNVVRLGLVVRALRRRRGWRQADLAGRAGTRQQVISRIERGGGGQTSLDRIGRVLAALEADADVVVRWRGGALDRVLDERHAALVGETAMRLEPCGWSVLPEVSYSEFGERGAIDLLGWHAESKTLLVVEVKTELISIEATLRKHDEKVRLAPAIARQRLGGDGRWEVRRLLVMPAAGSARRRVARHAAVLDRVYPLRGRDATEWLRVREVRMASRGQAMPRGAIIFLPSTPTMRGRCVLASLHRVRPPAR